MVKPGQIVKAKVIDAAQKSQRIALTMGLDDVTSRPVVTAQSGSQPAHDLRGRGSSVSGQAAMAPPPVGAMALALAKAR